jgi:hypothetical protein
MPDYLASVVVFGILITIFLGSWNSVLNHQTEFDDEDEMRLRATYTATFLVTTPGHPENWELTGNATILGFAEPDHVLQSDKLRAFRNLTYNRQQELLQARNFYMVVENKTGIAELDGEDLKFGKNYSNATAIVPVTRTVQLNLSGETTTGKLRFIVWR